MTDHQRFLADAAAKRRAVADAYTGGATEAECGERFGVSSTRIQQILAKEGVPKRPRGRRPQPAAG